MAQQEKSDVIILGATRDSMLQQVLNGNIPERIARQSDCVVIVVKGAEVSPNALPNSTL